MKLHVHGRRSDRVVAGRQQGVRIAVAIFATAALCLGPAMAASADDAADGVTATGNEAPVTTQPQDDQSLTNEQDSGPAPATSGSEEDLVTVTENGDAGASSGLDEGADATAGGGSDATGSDGTAAAAGLVESNVGTGTEASNDSSGNDGSTAVQAGDDSSGSDDTAGLPKDDQPKGFAARVVSDDGGGNAKNKKEHKVEICHVTSSGSNPYTSPSVDIDSIVKDHAHDAHVSNDGKRHDIIPSFWWDDDGGSGSAYLTEAGIGYEYEGLNYTGDNVVTYAHHCEPQAPTPEYKTPTISVDALPCLPKKEGSTVALTGNIGNLTEGGKYTVTASYAGGGAAGSTEVTGTSAGTATWSISVDKAVAYTITVTGPGDKTASVTTDKVKKCLDPTPLGTPIVVNNTEGCIDWGRDKNLQVSLDFSNLTKYVEYTVTVTKDGDPFGAPHKFTADATSRSWEFPVHEAGNYKVTVTATGVEGSAVVSVEKCDRPEPEDPAVTVDVGSCITQGEDDWPELDFAPQLAPASSGRVATVYATGLKKNTSYQIVVMQGGSEYDSVWRQSDSDGKITVEFTITQPGHYKAEVRKASEGQGRVIAWDSFKVRKCDPPVPVDLPGLAGTVTCTDGVLNLTLEGVNLDPEESYDVWVEGPEGSEKFTMETNELGVGQVKTVLEVEGNYSAWIPGLGEASPLAEFTAAKTCAPPVVVTTVVNPTPKETKAPALVNTGSNSTEPLLWAGVLTMMVASGLMLHSMRTRRTER